MKIDMKLELTNVYGGDGEVRIDKKEEVKLRRTKTRTKTGDLGSVDYKSGEQHKEVREVEVNTFRKVKGIPVLRLGGSHGKLFGLMKETGEMLSETKEISISKTALRKVLNTVAVEPEYVPLENSEEMTQVALPQILNTTENSPWDL